MVRAVGGAGPTARYAFIVNGVIAGEIDPPRVLVAIPTRNRAASLERAVRSALAQDFGRITVLISDNGSSDETAAVCQRLAAGDARVVTHRQPANLGLTGNYNWLVRRVQEDPGGHT